MKSFARSGSPLLWNRELPTWHPSSTGLINPIKMDNSPGDTNSRINPFSIENILSPPSSQSMQNVASNQPHPQLYYMAFMLQQQLQQQQQHFRHLQHFQQQQQYLQSFFLLQQQLQQQQQQQQQHQHQHHQHHQQHQQHHQHQHPNQHQLGPLKEDSLVHQTQRHQQQLSHRHLLQAHQQHLQQATQQQRHSSHKQSTPQKSHHNQTIESPSSPTTPSPSPHAPLDLPVPSLGSSSSAIKQRSQAQPKVGDEQSSTALSSLSSFVANIEPPQLGSAGSTTAQANKKIISINLSNHSRHQSNASSPAPGNKPASKQSSTTGAITPLNSTINTAINIAKAPPDLVQKQPPWVFCTRYSDRPSSGPRTRRAKSKDKKAKETKASLDEKRPRTAFTNEQLDKLRQEFQANSYLDEKRRKDLAERLGLNENQIKIWFQNKRAKMKKQSNQPNPLRGLLVAGGLYNHSTATSECSESYANGHDEEEDDDNNSIITCNDDFSKKKLALSHNESSILVSNELL